MTESESQMQAHLLAQALPFMQRYENKTIVVKYGGHAMVNAELGKAFASDIALLKQSGVNPIVVHGGGPQIGAMLTKMGIESKFEGGLRVTDEKTVEIVEMVLAGSINKEIVALINATISLLIEPASTLSTISTVFWSVTRRPPSDFDRSEEH